MFQIIFITCRSLFLFLFFHAESLPLPEVFGTTTVMGACGDEPCIIDGGGMGQVFVVGVSGTLTLKNLEITGGACNEGSAVLVSGNMHGRGGRLLALNVLFHNNTASGGGGAVMVKAGGLAHIRSCVFEDNMVGTTFYSSTQEGKALKICDSSGSSKLFNEVSTLKCKFRT